jgi:RimJ/RimL family protein N-acetyltransferase
MPLQSRHVPMTVEEYERLPFELGWKCDYHEGQAHYTPRDLPVITTLPVAPRTFTAPCPLRPAQPCDAGKLVEAYVAAFGETIEYCDYTQTQLEDAARRALADHFAGERGNPLAASRVALDPQNPEQLIGAALFLSGRDSARLDLLFVHPSWQGRQLATALVAAALNHLHQYGEQQLMSRYHIGNEASRRWHQRFGFDEAPDLRRAELYLQAARHEFWRLEQLGQLSTLERNHWLSECTLWQAQVDELERLAEQHGYAAVCAGYRW